MLGLTAHVIKHACHAVQALQIVKAAPQLNDWEVPKWCLAFDNAALLTVHCMAWECGTIPEKSLE